MRYESNTPTRLIANRTTQIAALEIEVATLSEEVAAQTVQPAFHMAPALLDTPDDADSSSDHRSAHRRPHRYVLPADSDGISTRQLTPQKLEQAHGDSARLTAQATVPITVTAK